MAHLKHVDFLVLHLSLPSLWPGSQGSFSGSQQALFSALGGEGAGVQMCVFTVKAEGHVGVCLHNLISALKMLLFICTVGELEHPPVEMILSFLTVFILRVLGLSVTKLKCLSCFVLHSSTALIFFFFKQPELNVR